jgi:3-deoxy-D-manno-octulosonic-acid transferase
MYFIYSLLYIIALICILPFEYFKRPREIRRRWLKEKFGLYPSSFILHPSSFIWVHAVSVGEVMAALPLLGRLKTEYPAQGIILSTITDTGQKVARRKSPAGTDIVYLPFDIPFILKSVVRKMKPGLLIIIETELWPNLLRVFKENGIPVILLNGRISEKSFHGYKKISFFMRKVLSSVDSFGMQNEEYAERLRSLEVDSRKIHIVGSFKFDANPSTHIPRWASFIKRPVIVAGSTHEGEEELMTSVYTDLKRDFPELNLILAPRHPERFGRVEAMLRSKGIQFLKRSELLGGQKTDAIHGTIILLDSVGELPAVYGISTIAIIGKSFRGHGGQNPLEPAYWGTPILCGPHMENFPVIQDFYKEGAAMHVNEEGLSHTLRELLLSPEKAGEIGIKAQKIYQKNSGAVERAMKIIEQYRNVSL